MNPIIRPARTADAGIICEFNRLMAKETGGNPFSAEELNFLGLRNKLKIFLKIGLARTESADVQQEEKEDLHSLDHPSV